MENCQLIAFATQLKNLLTIHDKTVMQIHFIDQKLKRTDQRIFKSTSEGYNGHTLHLLSKKSIIQGVRKMYQQYTDRIQHEIKKLSTLIIQSLQQDDSTEPELNNQGANQRDNDDFVPFAIDSFCTSSRSA